MKLKRMITGIVAAGALTFSMIGGAVADDNFGVHVNLVPNECTVTAASSDVTMGPFEYNGVDAYVLAGNQKQVVGLSMTVPEPGATCKTNFGLAGGVLTHEDDASQTISGAYLTGKPGKSVGFYGGAAGVMDVGQTWDLEVVTNRFVLGMTNVPDDVAAGTYHGTLDITLLTTP